MGSEQRLTATGWGPVSESERYVTLDALRGLAVFGILLANIIIFAFPAGSAMPAGEGGSTADMITALVSGFFVEGKFYTMFSILFGMGLALQSMRAEERGSSFTATYIRRLVVLLLIGIVHSVLLFSADILAFYAVVAFFAIPFRKAGPKTLLGAAILVYTMGILFLGGSMLRSPTRTLPSEPNWKHLLDHRDADTSAEMTLIPFAARRLSPEAEADLYRFMADEERIYQRGTWKERVRHRAVESILVGMPLKLCLVSWRVLGFFLLGMYFAKTLLFIEIDRYRSTYGTMLVSGFVGGMILQFIGGAAQISGSNSFLVVVVFLIGIFGGTVGVSLSYAAGITMLCARDEWSSVTAPLAAVGRMALSNYLLQSVICGLIFYGSGLGLFGQLSRAGAVALAVPVFLFQIAVSGFWLRFFRFGPAEWLWRTLSYGRLQPLLRDV